MNDNVMDRTTATQHIDVGELLVGMKSPRRAMGSSLILHISDSRHSALIVYSLRPTSMSLHSRHGPAVAARASRLTS
jgi:hypothetical protein